MNSDKLAKFRDEAKSYKEAVSLLADEVEQSQRAQGTLQEAKAFILSKKPRVALMKKLIRTIEATKKKTS